ncbi:ABC transporter permease [Virgibacillus doumboii]|uniref:ABC transporter permease n=1 Tax=Virgibacillus doumboii TaxID=2697503 RepID=UPI0013DFCC62|nr:ABC transporter permease [Virgibacillus doumboii]
MTFSIKRVNAIFRKDVKDIMRYWFVSGFIPLPLVLAVITGSEANVPVVAHYIVINLTFTMVASYLQCVMIAEEKEKNTLRGLMLSPATPNEILTGKSLLSFISTGLIVIIGAKLSGYEPADPLIISIAIFVSILFYIALGTLLGLVTKSVMEASVIIAPVMLLFTFGTYLRELTDEYPVLSFVEYLPNIQLVNLAQDVQTGAAISAVWTELAVIAGWVVVMSLLVVMVYKRREIDG